MRVVFFGTPDFAVPCLLTLLTEGHEVAAVVTQPDRPRGRGRKLLPSPVKEVATAAGLRVLQPERVSDPAFLAVMRDLAPAANIVVAFGQKIPPAILHLGKYGCLNVHASLLPRYRGAAPIQRAIMAGETVTGVTTMYMDEGWDTGDVILQKEVPIPPTLTGGELHDLLAREGAALLGETLAQIEAGTAPRRPQDHSQATYAPKLTRADEVLDWARPAPQLANQVRALDPWPGAVTLYRGEPLKVWRVVTEGGEAAKAPGTVLAAEPAGVLVQCGVGQLRLLEVQMAGGKRMPVEVFLRGHELRVGEQLATPAPAAAGERGGEDASP